MKASSCLVDVSKTSHKFGGKINAQSSIEDWTIEDAIFTASLRTARGQRKRPAGASAPPHPPINNLQSDNNP